MGNSLNRVKKKSESMMEKINPFGKQILPSLKKYSNKLSKLKTALDIGCANGADSRYLASLGLEVYAIDKKLPKDIKLCNNVFFKEIDILDFPFDKKYDVIVARNILHFLHPENRDAIMDKMYNALNANGYMFINSFTEKDPMVAKGKFKEGELYAWAVKKMKIVGFFEGEKADNNHDGSPGQHIHHLSIIIGKK
jgi:chemotaxis methyl-accepting protein methylase